MGSQGEIQPLEAEPIRQQVEALARQGLRVLAFAQKKPSPAAKLRWITQI